MATSHLLKVVMILHEELKDEDEPWDFAGCRRLALRIDKVYEDQQDRG